MVWGRQQVANIHPARGRPRPQRERERSGQAHLPGEETQLAADVSLAVVDSRELASGEEVAEGRTKLSRPRQLVSGGPGLAGVFNPKPGSFSAMCSNFISFGVTEMGCCQKRAQRIEATCVKQLKQHITPSRHSAQMKKRN